MSSPRRWAANRRNARASTGPKSTAGKRAASQNAVRHRLSVPLPASLLDPLRDEVAGLLLVSALPREQVDDLAEKIIEFERNMAVFRRAEAEWLGKPGQGTASLEDGMPPEPPQRAAPAGQTRRMWRGAKEFQALQRSLQALARLEARRQRDTVIALARYLRRARQQLLKALRNIA